MDSAYDHIQEESYPSDPTKQQPAGDSTANQTASNFNAEIQDAYKAISSSPWAAKLGGFLGTVRKQGEQYYDTASKQYATTSKTASAGVSKIITHARNLSVNSSDISAFRADPDGKRDAAEKPHEDPDAHPDRPDSLPADIVKEAEGMLSRFRSEAAKRLKDVQKAEDAADEALLKFGTNISNFLRDAVTIAPPESGSEADKSGAVLFESKDSSGKKVVHATRFDAQLHVIHSSLDSFLKDPVSPQWSAWKADFVVEKKTEAIAKDLEAHEQLRRAMEKCVPEKVEYGTFWCRYYFLRHVIESEEQRRREMLKASAPAEEEVAWDEDSDEDSDDEEDEEEDDSDDSEDEEDDSDSDSPRTPSHPSNRSATNLAASKETLKPRTTSATSAKPAKPTASPAIASKSTTTTTTTPPRASPPKTEAGKQTTPRRSNDEKSVADSDASYDLVSGATSRAPGSPMERKGKVVEEESDEEDWE